MLPPALNSPVAIFTPIFTRASTNTRNIDVDYIFLVILRYITILYYLNDVEAGGETAFPVADNETLNMEVS